MTDYSARIKALQQKHATLHQQIEELGNQPSHCSSVLRALKAQKLFAKDTITRLQQNLAKSASDVIAEPLVQVIDDDHASPAIESPLTPCLSHKAA